MDETTEGDDVARPGQLLAAGPGLVRLGVGMGWRVTQWAVTATVSASARVVRAAAEGESVASLMGDAIESGRRQARVLLGIGDDARLLPFLPAPARGRGSDPRESLRRRGAALLALSADVEYVEAIHPAYVRILDQLAPDEARILRLLGRDGAQPSVDVRGGSLLGSELVAEGLTMIGAHAGCRYVERVNPYLNNLHRLGLVWFSREPVSDLIRYQVLEAQPDVAAAVAGVKHGRTVRRSIHLTPFGRDFCLVCLPANDAPAGGTDKGEA